MQQGTCRTPAGVSLSCLKGVARFCIYGGGRKERHFLMVTYIFLFLRFLKTDKNFFLFWIMIGKACTVL